MTTASKINLIDLAGSERASQVLNDQVIKSSETAALRLKVTTEKCLKNTNCPGGGDSPIKTTGVLVVPF